MNANRLYMTRLIRLSSACLFALLIVSACRKNKDVNTPGNGIIATPFRLNCTVAKNVDSLYVDDAAKLAVNYLDSNHHPDTASISINASLQGTILSALAAVYNSASAARDSIVSRYNIHAVCGPDELKQVLMAGDSTSPWFQKLFAGNMVTDNAQADKIFADYQFSFVRAYSFPWSKTVVIKAGRSINLRPLFHALNRIQGVLHAEQNVTCFGGGITSIRLENWNSKSLDLVYGFGWGDCPSGCTAYRFWRFRVRPDCSVDFIESWGSPNAP